MFIFVQNASTLKVSLKLPSLFSISQFGILSPSGEQTVCLSSKGGASMRLQIIIEKHKISSL